MTARTGAAPSAVAARSVDLLIAWPHAAYRRLPDLEIMSDWLDILRRSLDAARDGRVVVIPVDD